MNKKAKLYLIINVLLIAMSLIIILLACISSSILAIIIGIIYLIIFISAFEDQYINFLKENPIENCRHNPLTAEEQQMVEDAKKLIESVDKNIVISDFNVYKVKFLRNGYFDYNEHTKELNIFINFKRFLKFGKDICFSAILHEILHSQNLKENVLIFDNSFLEGLNQLLTMWLIENYSQKYTVKENIWRVKLKIRNKGTFYMFGYNVYYKEVKMVKEILQKSGVDLKEVFINYIDLKPEFFKGFIAEEYFVKQ